VISRGTVPELALQRELETLGVSFTTHVRELPGTPDIVFPAEEIAVFVHGCYWHRHEGCQKRRTSRTRTVKWLERHRATVARDQRVASQLVSSGWWVLVAWECEISRDAGAVAEGMKNYRDARVASEIDGR